MKRILVIEDEPALCDELCTLLRHAGYEPIAVTEWNCVLDKMKNVAADLTPEFTGHLIGTIDCPMSDRNNR